MVKTYLIVVGMVWLILHCVFSWGMPDVWIGVIVLSQDVVFALLNYDHDLISCTSFVPLATLALLGGMNETVMRIFFRCFSEGDAHGLATLLTVVFSIMCFPSFLYFPRIVRAVKGRSLICVVAALSFGSCLWMFDSAVVVYVTLFLMFLSAFMRDIRGLVCIVVCGLMIVAMGECSHLTSQHLVVQCLSPKCQGWTYELWVLCLCAAYAFVWRQSMKDARVRSPIKIDGLMTEENGR